MIQEFIVLVLGTLGVFVLLHLLAWRMVRHLAITASNWAPRIRNWPAWARTRPVRAWVRLRFPRSYAILAARLNPRDFTGLPLTLFVLAAAYVALLLSGLVEEVLEADNVLRFDESVNALFLPWRANPLLLDAFLWITALGSGPALTAVAATATAFLWTSGRHRAIVPLWIAFLGAQATTWAGKHAIARDRPEFIEVVTATSPSFPSGHATGAMAVFGFLAYVLVRDLPWTRARFAIVYWTGTLILLIGFSRMFLSVHYTTDIASGFLVGVFWLLVAFALAEWARMPSAKTPCSLRA